MRAALSNRPKRPVKVRTACTRQRPLLSGDQIPHRIRGIIATVFESTSGFGDCQTQFDALLSACPKCSASSSILAGGVEIIEILQAQATAVQFNDRAVQLFNSGRLDDAIAELIRGLEVNPKHATGDSNVGFLWLKKGSMDDAIGSLLRAIELNPNHEDARDHLHDAVSKLIDELVQIGYKNGFLTEQPSEKFDDAKRHIRTRRIGALIAEIGHKGGFRKNGKTVESVGDEKSEELFSMVGKE